MILESNSHQLSLPEAIRLSIIKWECHVAAGGFCEEKDLPEEVKELKGYCGFCQRWRVFEIYPFSGCCMCEFAELAGRCTNGNFLYDNWCNTNSKQDAESILEIIKSIKN